MSKAEFDFIRQAYIKVYGDRWKEYFVKFYWCVYDGAELGSTGELAKWSQPDDCVIGHLN